MFLAALLFIKNNKVQEWNDFFEGEIYHTKADRGSYTGLFPQFQGAVYLSNSFFSHMLISSDNPPIFIQDYNFEKLYFLVEETTFQQCKWFTSSVPRAALATRSASGVIVAYTTGAVLNKVCAYNCSTRRRYSFCSLSVRDNTLPPSQKRVQEAKELVVADRDINEKNFLLQTTISSCFATEQGTVGQKGGKIGNNFLNMSFNICYELSCCYYYPTPSYSENDGGFCMSYSHFAHNYAETSGLFFIETETDKFDVSIRYSNMIFNKQNGTMPEPSSKRILSTKVQGESAPRLNGCLIGSICNTHFIHCSIADNEHHELIPIFVNFGCKFFFEDCSVGKDQFDGIPEDYFDEMINTESIGSETFINQIQFLNTGKCVSENKQGITPEKMNYNKKLFFAASYPLFILEES